MKSILLSALMILAADLALAKKDDNSVTLYLGEALMPMNLRIGFSKFDVGVDLRSVGIYAGPRLWVGQAYVGAGPLVSSSDAGMYGALGYEFALFGLPVVKFVPEFFAVGTALGATHGSIHLGLGAAW